MLLLAFLDVEKRLDSFFAIPDLVKRRHTMVG